MSEGLTERERVRARFLILRGRAHLARYEGLVQAANEAKARAVAVAVAKADAGVTKKAALEEAKDDIKKAVAAWHAQRLERTTLIDRFFWGLTSRDLGASISQFQYSEKIEHRQECAQLLIAYSIWCKIRFTSSTNPSRPAPVRRQFSVPNTVLPAYAISVLQNRGRRPDRRWSSCISRTDARTSRLTFGDQIVDGR